MGLRLLSQIKQHDFAIGWRLEKQMRFVADGGAITCGEHLSVRCNRPAQDLNPCMTIFLDGVFDGVPLREVEQIDPSILMDQERAFASVMGCDQLPSIAPAGGIKRSLFVAWLDTLVFGK